MLRVHLCGLPEARCVGVWLELLEQFQIPVSLLDVCYIGCEGQVYVSYVLLYSYYHHYHMVQVES